MNALDRSRHILDYAVKMVKSLEPGQRINVDIRELDDIMPHEHNGATFTAADRILENIVGSAYEYHYWYEFHTGSIVFERLEKPSDSPVYVSPDRREVAHDHPAGLYFGIGVSRTGH